MTKNQISEKVTCHLQDDEKSAIVDILINDYYM